MISDDCSAPDRFAALEAVVADDDRFVVSRSPRRLGFYRNFERALALAPAGSRFVALCDQDDAWHPDKLATLRAELGDARLVYSDARVVGEDGRLRAGTYWSRRRNNHADLLSLLVANSVSGAATLFPRDLLDDALPFPPAQFAHFHDHWLALCALATGEIRFVDRPLYDYVQHGGATLGHEAANRMTGLRERAAAVRRDPRERIRLWRMHYFVDACRLLQLAAVLELRCGDRMAPAKRRALAAFTRAERSPAAIARLAARGARDLARRRPETLGAEWMLFHAFAWRRALALSARDEPQRRGRLDAVPPPALDPRPGARAIGDPALRALAEKVAPLRLAVRDDAPARVNVLIPTFDLRHFFGGYIAKLNLARRLAEQGLRVRVVTVDPVGPLPRDWTADVERYSGLDGAVRPGRGRLRPRDAGPGGVARRSLRGHDVVDRPHRRRGRARARRRRPLPLPDPGVRAVHVPDGQPRRARRRVLPAPARRAVLDRAAARLLPPARARRLRRRRGGRRRLRRVPERDHGRSGPARRGARGPAAAAAAVLRPPRGPRRPQHVRAGRAGARARGRARRVRRLGAARDRDRRGRAAARPRRRDRRAAAAHRAARVRPDAARARRRPRADEHAASQPRADRDGVRRAC